MRKLEVYHPRKEEEAAMGRLRHRSVKLLQGQVGSWRIRSTHMGKGRQSKKPEGTEDPAIIAVEKLQLVIEAQISRISQGQVNSRKEPTEGVRNWLKGRRQYWK